MNTIDNSLNNITMYRLTLYYLIFLFLGALLLSIFGFLPFSPLSLVLSLVFLLGTCFLTNAIFAKVFRVPANVESFYISALILSLIITPIKSFHDVIFLFWAGVLAMSSKYIFTFQKKHLFNPVALAVAITSFAIGISASWWVGTPMMLPFVLVGILLVIKLKRFDLVFYFLLTALLTIFGASLLLGHNPFATLQTSLLYSPLLFFAFVMLTEPLTTPPTSLLQSLYGGLVGFLFAPQIHWGSFYTTPEIALILGNVFSFLAGSKEKLILTLKEKRQISSDIYEFVFAPKQRFNFLPGQYLEWTLPANHADSRGNRRYLTLASSPTEKDLMVGVKFNQKGSSFKNDLIQMKENDEIVASQLAGDFILPRDQSQKLVFLAGGIGITPFRSMIKFLLGNNQKRDIILFYSAKATDDFVYQDVFNEAKESVGLKTVYVITDKENVPNGWLSRVGRLSKEMLKEEVPDFKERLFYLSGPLGMIASFEELLLKIGLKKGQIKTDYFPGFA